MSYCGFSQIINILYNQIGTIDGLNQTMFLTDFVFKSYDENKTLIKDISGINIWFTGEYSVDGDIREYYVNNREKLYYDIENSYYTVNTENRYVLLSVMETVINILFWLK